MVPHVELPGHPAGWTSKERAAVAEAIGGVCRREGYFFVHNHGVPAGLVKEVYEEMRRFYQLPVAEKNRYDATEESQFLGYRGLGRERSRTHSGTEACEQYRIGNITDDLAMPDSVDFYHEHFPKSVELFGHLTRMATQFSPPAPWTWGWKRTLSQDIRARRCTASVSTSTVPAICPASVRK